jgi:hypothetical protein
MCNFLFDKKFIDLSLFQEEKDTRISEAWVLVVIGFLLCICFHQKISYKILKREDRFLQESEEKKNLTLGCRW